MFRAFAGYCRRHKPTRADNPQPIPRRYPHGQGPDCDRDCQPKPRPQRYEVSDPGCAGLRVVVFPSRRKKSSSSGSDSAGCSASSPWGRAWAATSRASPPTRPELNTPLSLAAARELATKALRQARSGSDPAAAKQRKRQEERAAESDTLGAIAGEYLRREGPRLRTVRSGSSDLDLLCASVLGRQPVAGITRGQYTRVLDHIADNNGPVRAIAVSPRCGPC